MTLAAVGPGSSRVISRLALRNSSGSLTTRWRTWQPPSRHARCSSDTSRVLSFSGAIA